MCYFEEGVPENEDDQKRPLFQFYKSVKTFYMILSTAKRKYPTSSKIPITSVVNAVY